MMNILQILTFGWYKPFNHNPQDFKLKLVYSWFSEDYISFAYTANGGRWWKTIKGAHSPFLDNMKYDWEWKDVSYRLSNSSTFNYEKSQWQSYQDILNYEEKEWEKYLEGCKALNKRRFEYAESKRKQIQTLNQ